MTFEQSPLHYLQSKHTQDIREAGNLPLTQAAQSLKHCQLQLYEFEGEIERMRARKRERQMERTTETER